MSELDFRIPAQKDVMLYYLRFKWRGRQRTYRGHWTTKALIMKTAARLAIREINQELADRGKLRQPKPVQTQ